jgi:enoyl-CoA hydratase/carnithine racemase
MTTAHDKPATGIARRDLLALAGTAAAALAGATASLAQPAPPSGATPSDQRATVLLERRPGGVLLVGIDRPETQNRIDIPTFNALGQAYYELEHDDDLRVAVLYAKGPDFSRGLDLASWGPALAAGPFRQPPRFLDPLATIGPVRSKPVVVAVQGQVSRVAHELFLAADVRVAAHDAVFNQGEVAAASFPGGGATVRFTREAGWGNAMRYMLTGDDWHADEAHRMGLVQELTPPGQQLERALALAQRIASAAPLGVRATLASAHRALADGEKLALATLQPEFGRLFGTADRQEYVRSLQERRAPVFVGR